MNAAATSNASNVEEKLYITFSHVFKLIKSTHRRLGDAFIYKDKDFIDAPL